MKTKEKLIMLYLYVCEDVNLKKWLTSYRQSNNFHPEFTDQEIITIYLFGILEQMSQVKQIYQHIEKYWKDWFPKLPSYAAFNNRLNSLPAAFSQLANRFIERAAEQGQFDWIKLIDSMPIIVAGHHRSSYASTASDICNKGYNSSKGQYYYGVKLHLIGSKRPSSIPLPQLLWITGAQESDITAARDVFQTARNTFFVGDKIYADESMQRHMVEYQNSELITPIKRKVNQEYLSAADNLYSTLVSQIRQPIESFFNWLNEKTNIQNARKVRSTKGLMIHIMGKLAAMIIFLFVLNP